uniref:Reverse transcriptase zinc-binding domain-containing protein n=1 Tax=Aegilops tauschii subsp. strangulata TaxID=200361 RepID=A0A453EDL1_AEGTS
MAEGLAGNSWAHDIQGVLGLHEIGQYLMIWQTVNRTILSNEPDQLLWRWTANGIYSAQSCYAATFHGSTRCTSWKLIWKSWAPSRVKFFHWLANQDCCWMAERLARCGLQHHPRCLLCDQATETLQHLLLTCPFARQTWYAILAWLRMPTRPPDQEPTVMARWLRANKHTPMTRRKALRSIALLVPWMIWKHKNECVFDNETPSIDLLVDRIKDEARCWANAGAQGLGVVLPLPGMC